MYVYTAGECPQIFHDAHGKLKDCQGKPHEVVSVSFAHTQCPAAKALANLSSGILIRSKNVRTHVTHSAATLTLFAPSGRH